MQPPPTKYAERDGVSIAYQVVGDGPFDLVMAPGFISHLDLQWTEPRYAGFLARLAAFSRLIIFDKPGTGLSDPIPHLPTLEERAADILAVMDDAGSERAALLGFSESGPAACLLAASRPERITALALCGTFPVTVFRAPEAFSPEAVASGHEALRRMNEGFERWGEGLALEVFAPSLTGATLKSFYATFARAAASPRMARALIEAIGQIDVRDVLPSVHVPTLVLHHVGDEAMPIEAGRLLAAGIPGARMVELEGRDHAFWFGDWRRVADEIETFLTGSSQSVAPDRALATVLFTDVVGSTEQAAELGDHAWRKLLERHDALAREKVAAQGGRIVKHMGDGMLATFDGPARAVRAAEDLLAAVEDLGVRLRAGIHTGEVELIGDDVGGMAVHIGARVGGLAGPGEILVSGTVRDLVVGSQLRFAERGEHELKGVPGRWRVFAVGEEREPAPEPLDAPADHMRRSDRVAVALARRAPRMMRFGAKAVVR
ncbi:MAG: alpha/beta fold hydrolase [Solirubrobacteraceae bacterium]